MNEHPRHIAHLLGKYLNGTIDTAELAVLQKWRSADPENEALFTRLTSEAYLMQSVKEAQELEQRIYNKIAAEAGIVRTAPTGRPGKKGVVRLAWLMGAAAVVLLVIATWYYVDKNSSLQGNKVVEATIAHDLPAPQTNRATITTDDGRTIYLDSARADLLLAAGNVEVVKLADGKLLYKKNNEPVNGTLRYNTLTNPRGSKVVDLTLSDGSRVWLNSESSIRFPLAFAGNERLVEISGEAYLEVAHQSKVPFRVAARGATIEVLGTSFVVAAYPDEAVTKASLLEGKILLKADDNRKIMTPGQQVLINAAGELRTNPDADVYAETLWKDGIFYFGDSDLQGVLRQLARWYDITVQFEGPPSKERFHGQIEKNIPLSQVLGIMEKMVKGVQFTIKDKTIIVSNK